MESFSLKIQNSLSTSATLQLETITNPGQHLLLKCYKTMESGNSSALHSQILKKYLHSLISMGSKCTQQAVSQITQVELSLFTQEQPRQL